MGEIAQFVELRPVLFGVAYRMLGSAAEADDIVQEAYLRWAAVDDAVVASPRAYLTTIVTRLSIDRLRSARARRETYRGPWLPEPIVVDETDTPELEGAELADNLSLAFLVLLEELAPAERAAFLLRDVFGYPYVEIARTLERSETACRQLVSRARHRIGDRRKRFDADRERSRELTRRFVGACATGDVDELMALLTDDVVIWTDGGGRVKSAPRPVVGPWRAARFLIHVAKDLQAGVTMREETLNGQPGVVFDVDGEVTSAVVFDVLGGQIAGIRVVANPEKLTALRPDRR
ncbi:MAG: RNA polymerase sigma-70 factor [Acidimicrobiales bacterium]